MIKRTISKLVEQTTKTFPVLLLTGPRQVGKSTLLKFLLNNPSFKYISLDNPKIGSLASKDPETFLRNYNCPLILDEVQLYPELFTWINCIVNESKMSKGNDKSNGMYILSGSNKHDLLDKTKESLAGRMALLSMHPLSLNELYNRDAPVFSFDKSLLLKRSEQFQLSEYQLFDLIFKGMLPSIHSINDINLEEFYSSYLETYIEKDLKQIIEIKHKSLFVSFISLLASNIGQELVCANYSKLFGVSLPTIKSWINALEKSGVIYLLRPYNDLSITKRMVKRPKLYFFDTGLAAHLMGIDSTETLMKSIFKGRFFENFALNELIKSFNNNGKFPHLYYYRDSNQNEIDVVYLNAGQLSKIEIKCGSSFSKRDASSFKKLNSTQFAEGHKAIICSGSSFTILDDGTLVVPITAI